MTTFPDDSTGAMERADQKTAEDYIQRIQEDGDIVNRPLGSYPLDDDQQLQDYMAIREDANAITQELSNLSMGDWVKRVKQMGRMEKLLQRKMGSE